MFAVDHVLVSDAVLDAPFACHLGSCFGACCVHGDQGAPLDADERDAVDDALAIVRDRLRPEAKAEIAKQGAWVGDERRGYHTTTVRGRECVFVVYDGGGAGPAVAKCAIQQAYWEGKTGWEKPVSCHLYPIRAETYGVGEDQVDVLNYERIDLCAPAIPHGKRTGVQVADFLERPLTRKYGADWFVQFRETLSQRRRDVGIGPQTDLPTPDASL
ncbi:DUF3109 family protein [Rubrivirga sp. IMCC43871]|uniref:DUF3109 family protein n=1 Tax=Rubrivirga sp. IMCC43871 TaxID=3391575 RepID=UPI00398F9A42